MKIKINSFTLVVALLLIPNVIMAEQPMPSILPAMSLNEGTVAKTSNLASGVVLARRGAVSVNAPRARPVNRPNVRPNTRPIQVNPQRAGNTIKYRTVNGRRMRYYTAGAGIVLVAGAVCYVNQYGSGLIAGSQCCIGGVCHTNFYVD